MNTLLQHTAAAQSATGLSVRRLCARLDLCRATYQRWSRRKRCGQPLLQSPGPAKTAPLPLAQMEEQIRNLQHGNQRTQGTGALYKEHGESISRRDLADLVRAERQHQCRARRQSFCRVIWHDVQTAWALDVTEWSTTEPGGKLYGLAARDLASRYVLGLAARDTINGDWVAEYLDRLIRHHGAPLFLKRDNGSVLHTPAVTQVLAEAGVLPLTSPPDCPRYNGGIEKTIGELKQWLPGELPVSYQEVLPAVPSVLEALRLEANARPRNCLRGGSAAETFYAGPRLSVDRPTRANIFNSLWQETWSIISAMNQPDRRRVNAIWRHTAVSWLRGQALITITNPQNPESVRNDNLLELETWNNKLSALNQPDPRRVTAAERDTQASGLRRPALSTGINPNVTVTKKP